MKIKLKKHYYCSKCGMSFDTDKESCQYHENKCGGIKLEYHARRNTINKYYLNDCTQFEDMHIEKDGADQNNQYDYTSYTYSIYFHNIKDLEIALRKLLIYVFDEMCECAKRELNVSFDYTPIKLVDFKVEQ